MSNFFTSVLFFAQLLHASGTLAFFSSLLIFLYTVALICASALVTGHIKFFIDIGCASIHITQLFFIFFLLIPSLHSCMNRGWQFWIFSTRCSRRAFFLGCSAASIAFICMNAFCSFIVCLGFCWWQTGHLFIHLWPFFASATLHGILLSTTAFLVTCFASYAGSYLIVAGFYFVALANQSFFEIISPQSLSIKKIALLAFSYLVPNLSLIDIQSATMYEQPIGKYSFLLTSSYILIFCLIQLIIALHLFDSKNW